MLAHVADMALQGSMHDDLFTAAANNNAREC
jgi:hypothetical protein